MARTVYETIQDLRKADLLTADLLEKIIDNIESGHVSESVKDLRDFVQVLRSTPESFNQPQPPHNG